MTYLRYQQLKPEDFKRLCGVHRQTFGRMVSVLEERVQQKKQKQGLPSKLSVEDQVLISLEYWREYRTYFHIGQAWELHESTVSLIVSKVENALIRAGIFQLPGKKQLLDPEVVAKLIVIDATETPIERPKKGQSSFLQWEEEATYPGGGDTPPPLKTQLKDRLKLYQLGSLLPHTTRRQ